MSYGWFCNSRHTNILWNIQKICGHKSETMWCMELEISMSDRHYKHTKFCQNLRGSLQFFVEWPLYHTHGWYYLTFGSVNNLTGHQLCLSCHQEALCFVTLTLILVQELFQKFIVHFYSLRMLLFLKNSEIHFIIQLQIIQLQIFRYCFVAI